MHELMVSLISVLSAAFAAPLASGWHELQDFPAVPPANLGSSKKSLPLAASPAAPAKDQANNTAKRENIETVDTFIFLSSTMKFSKAMVAFLLGTITKNLKYMDIFRNENQRKFPDDDLYTENIPSLLQENILTCLLWTSPIGK